MMSNSNFYTSPYIQIPLTLAFSVLSILNLGSSIAITPLILARARTSRGEGEHLHQKSAFSSNGWNNDLSAFHIYKINDDDYSKTVAV